MHPTPVAMKIVLLAAFTAFRSIDLKPVNLSLLGDICADAPELYIEIWLDIPSSSVWDRAVMRSAESSGKQ